MSEARSIRARCHTHCLAPRYRERQLTHIDPMSDATHASRSATTVSTAAKVCHGKRNAECRGQEPLESRRMHWGARSTDPANDGPLCPHMDPMSDATHLSLRSATNLEFKATA